MINPGSHHRDQVIDAMLQALQDYVPPSVDSLPKSSISVATVTERPVGLNNHIGIEKRGEFPIAAVKGIRLDALVRFQAWAHTPNQIDDNFTNLNSFLIADRDSVRKVGFLRLALENTLAAEQVASLDAWRRQAEYRVLYEYQFQDTDDSGGLIARIQIDSYQEQTGSPQHERTTVTDRMIRWDNQATPELILRGSSTVGALSALIFVAGQEPSGTVTLTRTADGLTGQPTKYDTWPSFLAAVSGPNPRDRHARVIFPSLQAFLDPQFFKQAGDPVVFPSINNVPNVYRSLIFSIDPAIQLPAVFDRLELTYQPGAQHKAFDHVAVLYLRATGG
jgi:hypothetical protein